MLLRFRGGSAADQVETDAKEGHGIRGSDGDSKYFPKKLVAQVVSFATLRAPFSLTGSSDSIIIGGTDN